MINDELIKRFLTDQCTPEEAILVADYLRDHKDILEQYLSQEEFLGMQLNKDLPETISAQWLAHIHREAGVNRGRLRKLWIRRMAVAAVLGGLLFGSALLFREHRTSPLSSLSADNTIPVNQQERKENRTGKILPLVLPDGSMVRMMPEAVVVYYKKFAVQRDIYLQGEADFEVVHDATHTFTVYSGEVNTQVLGTAFRVKALPEQDTITVRLMEGKVLVKADVFNHKTSDDITLVPGQEFTYSRKNKTASLRNFNTPVKGTGLVKAGSTGNKAMNRPDWYKFNDQPMKAVLDQLSSYYGVAIYYYPADIAPLYFDGKFEKTDSLEKILTDITLPNKLRFVREDSGYMIRKK
ncbi:FecR family protein [Flavitalea flava]